MRKKLLFVFNPCAGKGLLKAKLGDIIDIFTKSGYEVTAYPTQASLVMCLESVFALLTGAIVLQERMLPIEYAGAVLIFTAVVLAQFPDKKTDTGEV